MSIIIVFPFFHSLCAFFTHGPTDEYGGFTKFTDFQSLAKPSVCLRGLNLGLNGAGSWNFPNSLRIWRNISGGVFTESVELYILTAGILS